MRAYLERLLTLLNKREEVKENIFSYNVIDFKDN